MDRRAREASVAGDLLEALRRINSMLLTEVESETALLRTAIDALQRLGLRGAVMLFEGELLRVREATTHPVVRRIELLTGLRTRGYLIDPRRIDVYRRVLQSGEPVFLEDVAPVLRQLLPAIAQPLLPLFIASHRSDHGVYVPLRRGGRTIGLFNALGSALTAADLPAMDLLGAGLSLGLQELAARRHAPTDPNPSTLTMLEEQHAALNHHAIVTLTDADGRITWANERFCELSGYPLAELLGRTHRVVNSGVHPPAFFTELWDTISAGRVWRGELCNRAKDGHLHWLAATIVPLGGGERPRGYIAFRTDISARKQAELELERARDAAVNATEQKSRFLATASHEIRTPMNAIIGLTRLVLEHAEGEARENLSLVLDSANALLVTLNDILDFSKIEAGKLQLEPSAVALAGELDRALKPLVELARSRGLDLEWELDPALGTVSVDARRMRQVLNNLVGNALKFTDRGTVKVVASREGARVTCSVRDPGRGISPDELARHFTPWEQGAAAQGTETGAGLGLSISRSLAELMGGTLTLESRLEEGTTATLTLPLPLQTASSPSTLTVATPLPIAPLRVLVAEDNPINQRVVQRLLEKRGHAVEVVGDGAQAVARASTGDFDVVLMDLDMPVMGGEAAAQELRRLGLSLPIVAITANAMRGDRERCLAAGMNDYLAKPVEPEALDACLAKQVKR